MTNPANIREHGWQQGKVLPKDLLAEIENPALRGNFAADDIAVVISQDCDIVNPAYDKEPFIEIIKGSLVATENGNLAKGKNPRRIQIKLAITGGGERTYEFSIHDKSRIAKPALEKFAPSPEMELSKPQVALLTQWLAKRYIRPAFPDEFNRRIDAVRKQLKEILEKGGNSIEKLYLGLSSYEELPEGQEYKVTVIGVMLTEDFENKVLARLVNEVVGKLGHTLQKCKGITVIDSSLQPDNNITLQDMRSLADWGDFDHLSHEEA